MVKPYNSMHPSAGAPTFASSAPRRPVFGALQNMGHAIFMVSQALQAQQSDLAHHFALVVESGLQQAVAELDSVHMTSPDFLPALQSVRQNVAEALSVPAMQSMLQPVRHNLAYAELSAVNKAAVAFGQFGAWTQDPLAVALFFDFAHNGTAQEVQTAAAIAMRSCGLDPYPVALQWPPQALAYANPQQGWSAVPQYPVVSQYAPAPMPVTYHQVAPMPPQVAQQAQVFTAPTPSPVSETLNPAHAYDEGYEALETMQSQMEQVLTDRFDSVCLKTSMAALRATVQEVQQHVDSLEEYQMVQSKLMRSYRTLLASADKRCLNEKILGEVPEAFAKFSVYVLKNDQALLESVEDMIAQRTPRDLVDAWRSEVVAIARYAVHDDQRALAKKLLSEIDKDQDPATHDRKRKFSRANGDTLPDGLEKVVELRSKQGNVYYATATTDRGTYGKYRLAVDKDGNRVGIKVFRLEDDAADGLRLQVRDRNGPKDVPTSASVRSKVDSEYDAMRDGSKHLKLLDMLEIDGKLYAVTTAMEGELHAIRTRIPDARERNAVIEYAFYELAHELAALHGKKRVHGDFKSLNVLVNREGTVATADFGSAKVLPPRGNKFPFKDLVNTYPPPGYASGWGQDADMWALGVLLVNMHATQMREPFCHASFTEFSGNVNSYRNWYARLQRDRNGDIRLDRLPMATTDDVNWTAFFDGARRAAPGLLQIALKGLLNPRKEARWPAAKLAGEIRISDATRDVARTALEKMADTGTKEPKYQDLQSFAGDQALFDAFLLI